MKIRHKQQKGAIKECIGEVKTFSDGRPGWLCLVNGIYDVEDKEYWEPVHMKIRHKHTGEVVDGVVRTDSAYSKYLDAEVRHYLLNRWEPVHEEVWEDVTDQVHAGDSMALFHGGWPICRSTERYRFRKVEFREPGLDGSHTRSAFIIEHRRPA